MAMRLLQTTDENDMSTAFDNTTTWGDGTTFNTDDEESEPEMGLISLSTTVLITDVLSCGVQPVISLLGVVGNSLCVIVILCQGLQQTTNIILMGLAVTDLLYVLLSLRSLVECFARRFHSGLAVDISMVSQTSLVMLDTELAMLSRLYTCFIAVERVIVVRCPLKASSLLTRCRTLLVSAGLWILAFVSCIHCFFLLQVGQVFNHAQNDTTKVVTLTAFHKRNRAVLLLATNLVRPLFSQYVPVVLVLTCTFVILRTLKQSQTQRKEMAVMESSTNDQQQQQITKALLSVCVVFLVTNVPGVIVTLFRLLYGEDGFGGTGRYRNCHRVAVSVMLLFMLFNSSVNFMLYVIFNQKFAATFRKLLLLCWKA
ncbi:uncharacterized protein LOC143290142 [Babylonia areolata]|uniref:uncharacterized protein LOC143290142 n=1 Tax=Babylonia areolata TaxID=304850 RepID=UPI003FD1F2AA